MHILDSLTIQISYECNLVCRGCNSMSDHLRTGHETAQQAQTWLADWRTRITPKRVIVSGGEPLLNSEIHDWLRLIRATWPDAFIEISSNGTNLKKSEILETLGQVGNCLLNLTCHHTIVSVGLDQFRNELVQAIDQDSGWEHVENKDPTVSMKMQKGTVTVTAGIAEIFVRTYHGTGPSMRPWQSKSAAESHAVCASPKHPVLYKNKLYKCMPIANLKDTLTLHKLETNAAWWDYLKYQGFSLDDDLDAFVADIGQPNPKICTMCSPDPALNQVHHYEVGNVGHKIMIYPNWSTLHKQDATI